MKTRVLALLICLVFSLTTMSQNSRPADQFEVAKAAYDAGRFADAERGFAELIRDYPGHAELHFNRGNALARNGQLGPAIASFERARLLAPRDADVKANLKFLRESRGLPAPPARIHDFVLGALSSREWTWLALSGWWLGAGLLAASFPLKSRTLLRRAGILFLLIALAGGVGWLYWAWRESRPLAIVVAPSQKVRFAPLADATPHFEAPEGLALIVEQVEGGWAQVREGARTGWIPLESLEIVNLESSRDRVY